LERGGWMAGGSDSVPLIVRATNQNLASGANAGQVAHGSELTAAGEFSRKTHMAQRPGSVLANRLRAGRAPHRRQTAGPPDDGRVHRITAASHCMHAASAQTSWNVTDIPSSVSPGRTALCGRPRSVPVACSGIAATRAVPSSHDPIRATVTAHRSVPGQDGYSVAALGPSSESVSDAPE